MTLDQLKNLRLGLFLMFVIATIALIFINWIIAVALWIGLVFGIAIHALNVKEVLGVYLHEWED